MSVDEIVTEDVLLHVSTQLWHVKTLDAVSGIMPQGEIASSI